MDKGITIAVEEKNCRVKILCISKITFKNEYKMENFADIQSESISQQIYNTRIVRRKFPS